MSNLKVVEFPITTLADVATKLRELAEEVERGDYGVARECVVVLAADKLEVFGFGEVDGTIAHYLLGCAKRKIEQPMLDC